MNIDDYINKRVDNQINWYNSKSLSNKKTYKRYRTLEITLSSLIPLLILVNNLYNFSTNLLVAIIGTITAIIASLLALNKCQENWIAYRTTCETLKHHKYLFLTRSEPYHNKNANNNFVNMIESIISKENTSWSSITKNKKPLLTKK